MVGLLRLLFLGVVSWLFLAIMRRLFLFSSLPRQEKEKSQERITALLVHDPQCGRFVPEHDAFQVSLRGQALYFCSQECLDLYTNPLISKRQEDE